MHNKKLVTALTVAGITIACAVLIVLVLLKDASPSGSNDGFVNPSANMEGATLEAAPQLSSEQFELPPSVGTGSYTEPERRQDVHSK